MQSFGGGRTSSQQCQFQEPSQPQHSRTNKFYFQGPSCVAAPTARSPKWAWGFSVLALRSFVAGLHSKAHQHRL